MPAFFTAAEMYSVQCPSACSNNAGARGFLGFHGAPLWASLALSDNEVLVTGSMEPPSLGEELRNLPLWLTSACLSKDLDRKRMDRQVGQEASLKNAPNGCGFNEKWAWPLNFRMRYSESPLKEILYLPL